ncbi:hypothetical protein LEP1GSC059_2391 [Leptospira noguchii serovar Panama str. CZ214]|uniref:Uncharacterized protein n=1 Tax=Leptospira noguchii serovar Panama str. CZ214 TaxID=1001595 RepID=T0FTB0_9LEPT|nr:hypothetical protein LEP1GSC059_2391 [Leptospira noguchii serovar Panama str. CZ214]
MTLKSRSFYDKTLFANLFLPINGGPFALQQVTAICGLDGFA